MTDTAKGNILHVLGPLWIGLMLVVLIVGAFSSEGVREFIVSLHVMLFLLFFWATFIPGLIMCWMAEKQFDG